MRELLSQINIMYRFEKFNYLWFLDFRLRAYLICSALNPTLPLGRIFLQYNTQATINTNGTLIQNELLSFLNSLTAKGEKSNLFNETSLTLKTLLISKCYKHRESFSYYNTLIDIKNCFNSNYQFRSMISYNSSNSGIQMLALNLRSKQIARMGSLLQHAEPLDAYTSLLNYNTALILKFEKIILPLKTTYYSLFAEFDAILTQYDKKKYDCLKDTKTIKQWPPTTESDLEEFYRVIFNTCLYSSMYFKNDLLVLQNVVDVQHYKKIFVPSQILQFYYKGNNANISLAYF